MPPDLDRDLENLAFRQEFVAASDEIAATDAAASAVLPEELHALRNKFIDESSAEFGDINRAEVDELLDAARQRLILTRRMAHLKCST